MSSRHWVYSAVLVLAGLLALIIALRVPAQFAMPGYFADIRLWAASGHIDDTFTPLAYPLFAAPVYRMAGVPGIVAEQAILFVLLGGLTILILERLHLPTAWVVFGSFLVLLQPELLLSIPKVWDVDLSVFLLLLLAYLCLWIQKHGPAFSVDLIFGIVLGTAVFCRPNYVTLVAAFFFALASSRPTSRWRVAQSIATAGLASVAIFSFLGYASHGSAFVPRNGPYNLFAGQNPYSRPALLSRLNAEPSIPQAFASAYPPPVPDVTNPTAFYSRQYERFYTQQSMLFIRRHPGEELRLVGIKFFTLFRADTKVHPFNSLIGFAKLALAFISVLFLLLLVFPGAPALRREDWLLITFYGAYILPFLITNSDPRFRIPLDALMMTHSVRLIYFRRKHLKFLAAKLKPQASSADLIESHTT